MTAAMPVVNEVVASRFDWRIVVASAAASYCGCQLAVELLNRRGTGIRSKRSWAETITCAICLGLIGIWCMHFIGNRAIILGDGSDSIQLVYDAGFSTLSAFLPICILTLAFAIAELQYSSRLYRCIALFTTGICSGFSVVGMHYIGNLGISNYDLHYSTGTFAGSFAIAIADCLLVMALFYTWREAWISIWYLRLICAVLLAVGICAMHFVASTHCVYHFKHASEPNAVRSRNIQVIVAGILCAAAGIAIGVFLVLSHLRDKLQKERSQKVMLSCVMFHPNGRMLVTTDGSLPAREITNKYHIRTFRESFDSAHEVFRWIFRISRNWGSISDLIPEMRTHINALRADGTDDTRPNSAASIAEYDSDTYRDYSVIFRERFCVAAASLATSLSVPITRIGILFDRVIETDTLPSDATSRNTNNVESTKPSGNGQLLFLVRQLTEDEGNQLINSGFKFAFFHQVGRNIANTMQIPLHELENYAADLRRYVNDRTALEKTGTWLSCFAMISKLSDGFNVAVKTKYQDQLPDVQILSQPPVQWESAFLNSMHKEKFTDCVKFLDTAAVNRDGKYTHAQQNFAIILHRSLIALRAQVPSSWIHNAVFLGKELQGHFSEQLGDDAPITSLYAFVALTEVHASFESFTEITPIPLALLKTRQQCYSHSPNHAVLSKDAHDEFTLLLARKIVDEDGTGKKRSGCLPKLIKKIKKPESCRASETIDSNGDEGSNDDNSLAMDELVDPMEMIRQSTMNVTQTAPTTATKTISTAAAAEEPEDDMAITVTGETVIHGHDAREWPLPPVVETKDDDTLGLDRTPKDWNTAITVATPMPELTFVDELIEFVKINFKRDVVGQVD